MDHTHDRQNAMVNGQLFGPGYRVLGPSGAEENPSSVVICNAWRNNITRIKRIGMIHRPQRSTPLNHFF
jgi:hypothetical protein